ncbi:MAG: hypothetical protein ABIN94_09355 [Ferruginibacter sp.]
MKFLKNNFLYGRPYHDIDTLQSQALNWLQRTGNGMPHTTIRKVPEAEWLLEKPYLTPWVSVSILPSYITRNVHIDNIISFEGNTYSVPQGTYKKNAIVMIWLKDDELHIHDDQRNFLCKHPIAPTKGNKVINTDHKRDKSTKLKALVADIACLFSNPSLAAQYFEMIRQVKPRYLRDQVLAIRDAIKGCDLQLVNIVLEKCVQERYLGATLFLELLSMHQREHTASQSPMAKIILLDPGNTAKAEIQPAKRNLEDYDQLF